MISYNLKLAFRKFDRNTFITLSTYITTNHE